MLATKQKLQSVSSEATPVKQLKDGFKPGGRLSGVDLTATNDHFIEVTDSLKSMLCP